MYTSSVKKITCSIEFFLLDIAETQDGGAGRSSEAEPMEVDTSEDESGQGATEHVNFEQGKKLLFSSI